MEFNSGFKGLKVAKTPSTTRGCVFVFILRGLETSVYSHATNSHNQSRVELKCDCTRWRTEGEVKGKKANGVGSQYAHTTWEHGVSRITTADAHTSPASSRLNWRPRRFKWTGPFRRKTKTGFCACAITLKRQSTCFYPGTQIICFPVHLSSKL